MALRGLSAKELEALDLTAKLADLIGEIISKGPTSSGDWAEAVFHIHGLQRMLMSQSAARQYPYKFRLLGGLIQPGQAPPGSASQD